jgi:hypothetical protein
MNNYPKKPERDNTYYLDQLRREIDAVTEDGELKDVVYLHGFTSSFQKNSYFDQQPPETSKNMLYNVRIAENGLYEIERLITPADSKGEYLSKQVYTFADNSTSIFIRQKRWDGHFDAVKEYTPIEITETEIIAEISSVILDGLRLAEDEARGPLNKHRKAMNQYYGEENEVMPGKLTRGVGRLMLWAFGPKKDDEE